MKRHLTSRESQILRSVAIYSSYQNSSIQFLWTKRKKDTRFFFFFLVRFTPSYDQLKKLFYTKSEKVILGNCQLQQRRNISPVFSVTPFKIGQNKNHNRSIDKVRNLGNERRQMYKDPRQESGQRNISYTRYPKKCFIQS